jgi:hypothetical protein
MSRQLKTIGEVFSESWQLYKERAVPIILVVLITTVIVFVAVFITVLFLLFSLGGVDQFFQAFMSGNFSPQFICTVSATLFVLMILIVWSQTATLAVSIDESLGVAAALKAGWKYFFPVTWVGSLYLGVVISGLTFFILPGIILGLSMCLCLYALIDDDLHGMDALVASHLFMRGHWWNTLWKLFPLWLVSIAVGQVPLVGMALSILITPFLLLYMAVVYRDLQHNADVVDFQTPRRGLWWFMAIAGMILPLLGLLGAAVTLGPQLPGLLDDLQQGRIPGIQWPGFEDVAHPKHEPQIKPPQVTRLSSVDGFRVWNDPVGDTANPLLDVQEVAIQAGRGQLHFRIKLADSFDAYFAATDQLNFEPLLSLYLDTDLNRDTGGKTRNDPFREGYEYAVDIVLERQLAENKVQIALYRLEDEQRHSLGAVENAHIDIADNTLNFTLDAEQFALHPDTLIRMCFYEFGQQQGSSLAKDKIIPY